MIEKKLACVLHIIDFPNMNNNNKSIPFEIYLVDNAVLWHAHTEIVPIVPFTPTLLFNSAMSSLAPQQENMTI